ncbi:MAG: AraC family transcriptional regulator ligand-binding domain-containing protein [Pseudomonadales bacterium]
MLNPGSEHSSSKGNMLALSRAIESYGIDSTPILQDHGIDLALLDDTSRIPSEAMDAMICAAVQACKDDGFGLRFVDFIQPTSYHALGVALLYSPTLRAFCQRLERYFAIITTLDDTRFVEQDGQAYLCTRPLVDYSETLRRCHSDGWASWVVKLIRLMVRPDFAAEKISLVWQPPAELLSVYQDLFQSELEFSASEARIHLDPCMLDEALPTSNAELARQNDQVVTEFLTRMNKADLPGRVRTILIALLPSGEFGKVLVADAVHMSARTLHNKLDAAGTSYQHILDQSREELAREYIGGNDLSVSEIAYLLGFGDVSSFSRAFKRWTGKSPRAYRHSDGA